MKTIRALFADDHTILLQSFAVLLSSIEGLEVVGLASSGEEACKLAATLKPDVVVMDVSMPGIGGTIATQRLKERFPQVKVLAFSGHDHQAYSKLMMEAGAVGYVSKHAPVSEIVQAIIDAASQPASSSAIAEIPAKKSTSKAKGALSVQETQILRMTASGVKNYEIAKALNLSIKTIDMYIRSIKDKLSLRSRAELVQYAVTKGWLESAN